ncbi:MAG TPA: GIY-YIG nuclease family protein [Candidatus Paceibacterota bacterium]|jgi:excinuclease ABC subunit C|nr:GIY-YIG nuclease family protein [Candidatus Paceibacterota bacterium]
MKHEYIKKIKLPDKSGVYFFLKNKKILYIGKATSLKDRTKSYFSKDLIHTRGPLVLDMVFKADHIKWHVTESVLEALILEANLIKRHQPYYNTREKDDKSFNYVCITKEKLPKVVIVRGSNLKNESLFGKVFGPYTSGSQLREAMKIIRKIFPFLDDKSKNYLEFYKQINLIPDLNDRTLYLQNIKNIKLFFSGKKKQIFRNLKKEMQAYAKMREFEKAGEVKRQLFALQHINDVSLLKIDHFTERVFSSGFSALQRQPLIKNSFRSVRIEAYDIAHMAGKNMVGVMTVVEDGEAAKNEYKKFRIRTQNRANDTGALSEVLERRLAHKEWPYPHLIVIDGGIAQINAAKAILKKMDVRIEIVSVVKDQRHKAREIMGSLELAKKFKSGILLGNSEAHRFAIAYHKKMRSKNFLKDF